MTRAGAEAAWNPAEGSHSFAVRLAVTRLPVSEPEVVVAQVHSGVNDLPTIRLEGAHLFVAGDKSQPLATLTKSYRLGTTLTLGFVASGGQVQVFYHGQRAATVPVPALSTYFFKSGAYEQSHKEGDGFAQVVILAGPVASHDGVLTQATPAPEHRC